MANSAMESLSKSDTLGIRQISSSLFGIPGFLAGFSPRSSSDSDSVWSPTSPLDFQLFSKLCNPFSVRSPKLSSSRSNYQKKWDCSKIGLGIVNTLADEFTLDCGDLDSPRKNIIFGPEVNAKVSGSSRHSHELLGSSFRSNSVPRNYTISSLSQGENPSIQSCDSIFIFGSRKVQLEPKLVRSTASCIPDFNRLPSSLVESTKGSGLTSRERSFFPMKETPIGNSAVQVDRGSRGDDSFVTESGSLPIPIGSLSAKQIELSEDYTCIISHGPNPRTTHIFGDCILECHTNESSNFDKEVERGVKSSLVAKCPEGSTPNPTNEFLSFCYSCKKELEKDEEVNVYRGEKVFCSFDCQSAEIFAEEETAKTCICSSSSISSPESSYHEDMFLMGLPITS